MPKIMSTSPKLGRYYGCRLKTLYMWLMHEIAALRGATAASNLSDDWSHVPAP